MYFSNFAPYLLNEETFLCGHIYDNTSSRRKGCQAYSFFLKTADVETEFWVFFIDMSYDKSSLIIFNLVEIKPTLWLKTNSVSKSTRTCYRKEQFREKYEMLSHELNVVSKTILWYQVFEIHHHFQRVKGLWLPAGKERTWRWHVFTWGDGD